MSRIKVNNEMYLQSDSVTKECLTAVFESIHQDMWDLQMEASHWNMEDHLIYGYSPWDYVKEIEICMKYSQNVQIANNQTKLQQEVKNGRKEI